MRRVVENADAAASKNPENPSEGGGYSEESSVEGGAPRTAKNPEKAQPKAYL